MFLAAADVLGLFHFEGAASSADVEGWAALAFFGHVLSCSDVDA